MIGIIFAIASEDLSEIFINGGGDFNMFIHFLYHVLQEVEPKGGSLCAR